MGQTVGGFYATWVPNYLQASNVEEVDAKALNPKVFYNEFVSRNRPCLVRQGARHWPAIERWQSASYLKQRCGENLVKVNTEIQVEGDPGLDSREKRQARQAYAPAKLEMPFREFVEKAEACRQGELPKFFFMYNYPLAPDASEISPLDEDTRFFSFLPAPRNTPLCIYNLRNAFMYRSAVTDWHYHVTAEALLTQVRGTKEVVLLPPDNGVWDILSPVFRDALHIYSASTSEYPALAALHPIKAVVEPGDCLYIPNYWPHMVATIGESLGASVTTWWDSPLQVQMDVRLKVVRQTLLSAFSEIPKWKLAAWLPLMAAGIAWAPAYRAWRSLDRLFH
jgi:hypothetical protein